MEMIKPYLSYLWILPNLFLAFWSLSRFYGYFFLSVDEDLAAFANDLLPKPTPTAVVTGFRDAAAIPLNAGFRYYLTRAHIICATILGFMMTFQLQDYFRKNYLNAHRIVGKLTIPLMVFHQVYGLYICYVAGMVYVGYWVDVYAKVSFGVSQFTFPLALYFVKQKNIKGHRQFMILTAGCMYMIPLQRFIWMICSTNNIWGPYESWEYYRETVMGTSALVAMILSLGIASAFAFWPEKAQLKTN